MNNNEALFASIRLIAFDFDGVFTDNTVEVSENGSESVRCWRSDGLGLSGLSVVGVKACIISTERNPVVTVRANKLQIKCKQGVEDKARALLEVCNELAVSPKHTLYVGNDINDIPAFQIVGVAVGVADAYSAIDSYVMFKTERPGGKGAVREICDIVIQAKMRSARF